MRNTQGRREEHIYGFDKALCPLGATNPRREEFAGPGYKYPRGISKRAESTLSSNPPPSKGGRV